MRGLSGTDPRCDRAHGGLRGRPGSGAGCAHDVGSEADFPGVGGDSKAGQQEGKVTWFPCCTLGRPAVQGGRAPRWLLLLGDRSWSGRGDIDSPAPGRPCRVLGLGEAGGLLAPCAGHLRLAARGRAVPPESRPVLAVAVSGLWHSTHHVCSMIRSFS